jgi:hypothetical protein
VDHGSRNVQQRPTSSKSQPDRTLNSGAARTPPAEIPTLPVDLSELAVNIKAEWDGAHGHHGKAIHRYLRIGRALLTARSQLPGDRAFGDWFRSQGFVFTTEWGRQMRRAAQHGGDVREWWRQELEAGREPSLKRCLATLARTASETETAEVATPVATNRYPESERRVWLEEPLHSYVGRGDRLIKSANDVEESLRAWEADQTAAIHEILTDRLTENNSDDIENTVAEILAVLRGE